MVVPQLRGGNLQYINCSGGTSTAVGVHQLRWGYCSGSNLTAGEVPQPQGKYPNRGGSTPTAMEVPQPQWNDRSCTQLWFDPAESAVQDQAIAVVRDVIARYDVDAVHLDDFFYPYPDSRCPNLDFPDSASYARYQQAGGVASRADWRRANVNRFVERLYAEVHAAPTCVWGSVHLASGDQATHQAVPDSMRTAASGTPFDVLNLRPACNGNGVPRAYPFPHLVRV